MSKKGQRRIYSFADAVWRSYLSGLHSANGKRIVLDLMSKAGRKSAVSIVSKAFSLLRTAVLTGAFNLCKKVKQESTKARLFSFRAPMVSHEDINRELPSFSVEPALASLSHGSLRHLREPCRQAKFSFVGRSLPKGDNTVVRQSIEKHFNCFTKKSARVPPGTYESMRNWASHWGVKHPPTSSPFDFSLTAGSCLEKSRKEGGLASFLVESLGAAQGCEPAEFGDKPDDIYDVDWQSMISQAQLRNYLLNEFKELPRPLRASVEVITERGYKARIVTKSPGAAVALGHLLRRVALSSLKQDDRITLVLEGGHLEAVRTKLCRPVPGPVEILSADLSAATDNLTFETSRSLWLGYCDGIQAPEDFRQIGLDLLGPMHLTYPDNRQITTDRGALMGLPITWFILCLANMWAADKAIRTVRSSSPCGLRRQPYVICGDDLVGIWTKRVIKGYENNIPLTGMKFSTPDKHLSSNFFGIFTEEIFLLRRVEIPLHHRNRYEQRQRVRFTKYKRGSYAFALMSGELRSKTVRHEKVIRSCKWGLSWHDGPIGFSLRGLVTVPGHMPGESSLVPWWVAIGPSMTMAVHRNPKESRLIRQVGLSAHPGLATWAAKRGLPPFVPRELGVSVYPTKSLSQGSRELKLSSHDGSGGP